MTPKKSSTLARPSQLLTIVLVLAILGTIGGLTYITFMPKTGEKFTEFYILDKWGKTYNYPADIALGKTAQVILAIVNREHETTNYRVSLTIDGELMAIMDAPALAQQEKWQQSIDISPKHEGQNQTVEFVLYRDDSIEPYRKLHLLINVN